MRINKYIASTGMCSRRKAEEYIQNGKVTLNGKIVDSLSTQVNEKKDVVCVNQNIVKLEPKKVYIMLNKPKGYITTSDDKFNRPKVIDLIKEDVRVFPIGRLDMDTEGLLLFTNDGEFANLMMHPKSKVSKTYVVRHRGIVNDVQMEKLQNGVKIDDYITKPAKIKRISKYEIEITITEGKNRQIRKMCESVGIILLDLKRTRIGRLTLGDLKVGEYKYITEDNIKKMIK